MLVKNKHFTAPTTYAGVLKLAGSRDMIEDRKLNPVHVVAAIALSDTGAGNLLRDCGLQDFFVGKAIERMKSHLPQQTASRKLSKSFQAMLDDAENRASGPEADGVRETTVINLLVAAVLNGDLLLDKFLEFASPHDTAITKAILMERLLDAEDH